MRPRSRRGAGPLNDDLAADCRTAAGHGLGSLLSEPYAGGGFSILDRVPPAHVAGLAATIERDALSRLHRAGPRERVALSVLAREAARWLTINQLVRDGMRLFDREAVAMIAAVTHLQRLAELLPMPELQDSAIAGILNACEDIARCVLAELPVAACA